MSRPSDRDLGMDRRIPRRDFLNGAGVALTGALGYPWFEAAAQTATPGPDDYPPARTGMRGSHDGSWEVAHALRDGQTWDDPVDDPDPVYDLVVVGAGISGLAAAYFFRDAIGQKARILLIDNHDDFGGHAKRNEFRHGDRLLIGYGGTQSIEGPSQYSKTAMDLLVALGIRIKRFYTAFDQNLYPSLGLRRGVFFDKETFGVDRLVVEKPAGKGPGDDRDRICAFAARAPFTAPARADFIRLHNDRIDYLPGLSAAEKLARLKLMSYAEYLRDVARVDRQVIAYFQQRPHGYIGVGIDAVSALECLTYPGLQGLALAPREPESEGHTEPYIFHFPDGNASIARLLVRSLIPRVAPGRTMEDIVTVRFDYARLDEPDAAVRIRLSSTAVNVRHATGSREVAVTYVRSGVARRVRGRRCVLACYHSIIPRLCPELPERQRAALAEGVKVPLVYVNALLRNWTAFQRLGISQVYGPNAYFSTVALDFPVALGSYRNPRTPAEPMIVTLHRAPCKPGLPKRSQNKIGRFELVTTTFETFEREIRGQLTRILAEGGFDAARDIEAITVNRWPHGYADEGDLLTDPEWTSDDEKPWIIARQPLGRIAIANADAARRAYTDAAINQARRAIRELLANDRG
jgi:spermidine dehydrogenase